MSDVGDDHDVGDQGDQEVGDDGKDVAQHLGKKARRSARLAATNQVVDEKLLKDKGEGEAKNHEDVSVQNEGDAITNNGIEGTGRQEGRLEGIGEEVEESIEDNEKDAESAQGAQSKPTVADEALKNFQMMEMQRFMMELAQQQEEKMSRALTDVRQEAREERERLTAEFARLEKANQEIYEKELRKVRAELEKNQGQSKESSDPSGESTGSLDTFADANNTLANVTNTVMSI